MKMLGEEFHCNAIHYPGCLGEESEHSKIAPNAMAHMALWGVRLRQFGGMLAFVTETTLSWGWRNQ